MTRSELRDQFGQGFWSIVLKFVLHDEQLNQLYSFQLIQRLTMEKAAIECAMAPK